MRFFVCFWPEVLCGHVVIFTGVTVSAVGKPANRRLRNAKPSATALPGAYEYEYEYGRTFKCECTGRRVKKEDKKDTER